MLKSTVGIIIKKTNDYWIVEIIRPKVSFAQLCDYHPGAQKTKLNIKVYFDDCRCDIFSFNRTLMINDLIKFTYKKIVENNKSKIIVYGATKLVPCVTSSRISEQIETEHELKCESNIETNTKTNQQMNTHFNNCCEIQRTCDKFKTLCPYVSSYVRVLTILRSFLLLQFLFLIFKYIFYVLFCS